MGRRINLQWKCQNFRKTWLLLSQRLFDNKYEFTRKQSMCGNSNSELFKKASIIILPSTSPHQASHKLRGEQKKTHTGRLQNEIDFEVFWYFCNV